MVTFEGKLKTLTVVCRVLQREVEGKKWCPEIAAKVETLRGYMLERARMIAEWEKAKAAPLGTRLR